MTTGDRIASLLFTLAIATGLLYLAVPRGIAAVLALPQDGLVHRLRGDSPPELAQEELEALVDARQAALAWTRDGRAYADLALIQLLQAVRETGADGQQSPAGATYLAGAIESFEIGLSEAPVNPHGWTQLAYARTLSDGVTMEDVVRTLVMSIYTGPYEPGLVYPRLKLFMDVWDALSDEEKAVVYDQARFGWDVSRDRLVRLVAPLGVQQANVVRVALAGNPAFLFSFERRLKWARLRLEQEKSSP